MSLNIPPPPPLPAIKEDLSFKPSKSMQKDNVPFGRYAIYSTKNPYGWTDLHYGRNNIIFLYDI